MRIRGSGKVGARDRVRNQGGCEKESECEREGRGDEGWGRA